MDAPEGNRFIYEQRPAPIRDFIEFWAARYYDPHEELYTKNINGPHTADTLGELFKWKVGPFLFGKMLKRTVEPHFLSQIEKAKQLPSDISGEEFLKEFLKGGPIYRIFWLHCWYPDRFPIYDQHVYRAMAFLTEGKLEELSKFGDQEKVESYLRRYLSFFRVFRKVDLPFDPTKDGVVGRKADRALWAFGKSLPTRSLPPLSQA